VLLNTAKVSCRNNAVLAFRVILKSIFIDEELRKVVLMGVRLAPVWISSFRRPTIDVSDIAAYSPGISTACYTFIISKHECKQYHAY